MVFAGLINGTVELLFQRRVDIVHSVTFVERAITLICLGGRGGRLVLCLNYQ
jgi:hypothetical protein